MKQDLPTAVLGRTGLEVTRLGFGTALGRELPGDEWDRLLHAVLDSGINFIDTANDYGARWKTPAEEHIGRYISGRRSEYYLATKCGCAAPGPHVWTRENAFRGLHESLERLNTDYVDLMQYHNPTVEEAEAGDLVTVLQDMREQGKVRWLGISTTLPLTCRHTWNGGCSTPSRCPTRRCNGNMRSGSRRPPRPASASSCAAGRPRENPAQARTENAASRGGRGSRRRACTSCASPARAARPSS